jgi:putative redox protein
MMSETQTLASVTAENTGALYRTTMSSGVHTLVADEPPRLGGADTGPDPMAYLCMSLASCKAITMRMYAQRKGWTVDRIRVAIKLEKDRGQPAGQSTFYCSVKLEGNLNAEQCGRMLHMARMCPVERLLSKPVVVVTVLE